MLKLEKKQVKFISIVIALVFMGSVVALALTQTGSGIASAASSVNVGVINYAQVMNQQIKKKQIITNSACKEFKQKCRNSWIRLQNQSKMPLKKLQIQRA